MIAMSITITAIYENGILRPLSPLALPESARVRLHIESETDDNSTADGHLLYDLLSMATDLGVNDLAEQHDHYLYGVDKQ
jgi:predicted DNA-binding antitoxin AbrB/MazE fold protein